MIKETAIKLFNQKQVRCHWDGDQEKWYFSIVDVLEVLTESVDPQAYWRKLKERLKKEGNETVTNCHALKMISAHNKMQMTGIIDRDDVLVKKIQFTNGEHFRI
jgi:hypothetical protein